MDSEFDNSPQGTVTRLIQNLKDGESQAAQRLWELYFRRMVGMAREKLHGMPKRMADEEDVALSAFHSFCQGAEGGRFTQLVDRENLWPLLVSITAHKAVDLIRYHNRQKRGGTGHAARDSSVVGNVTRDGSKSGTDKVRSGSATLEFEEIISQEPTPEFAAQVADEFQSLLARLEDDTLQSVALWKLEGFTNDEIAEKLDCVPRTVERKLQLIRTLWQRSVDASE
ncbi:MAG: ECF-type sigma factor [Planctomycetales bacterium]|jgi:DNA-directed RNA polymerase specialized sigma24 family protein